MLGKIKDFFKSDKEKELEKENEKLKKKLLEKQEHINKTNAYWKGVIHNLKKRQD